MLQRLLLVMCYFALVSTTEAAEESTPSQVEVRLGFDRLPSEFLQRVGGAEADEAYHLFSDIEAYFLVCRKDAPTDENWPPKRHKFDNEKKLTAAYQSNGRESNWRVVVAPRHSDDGAIIMTVTSTPDSEFKLKEPLRLSLPRGSVAYIPALSAWSKDERLYLVIATDAAEE